MNGTLLLRAILAQARIEVQLTMRRGESLLVTTVIPAVLLGFFASAQFLPASDRTMRFLLPGTLALAVISTGLVSLGIATAYERYYGVLKLLGATPLPRFGLVSGKLLAVLAVETLQVLLLAGIAVAYGWRPEGSIPLAALILLLGTLVFSTLGLLMAGTLRAEATLAGANGLFLFFLLLGGLYVPIDHLPVLLQPLARILPAGALADLLRAALGERGVDTVWSLAVLTAWACVVPGLAVRFFRWE